MIHVSQLIGLRFDGRSTVFAQVISRLPGQGALVAEAFSRITSSTETAAKERDGVAELICVMDNVVKHSLVFPDPAAEEIRAGKRAAAAAAEAAAEAVRLEAQVAQAEDTVAKLREKRAAHRARAEAAPGKPQGQPRGKKPAPVQQ